MDILRLLLDNGADKGSIYFGKMPIEISASNGHFRASLFLMRNLQDFVSFSKIIWNNIVNNSTAKVITLVAFGLGVLVLALFLMHCFKEGSCR